MYKKYRNDLSQLVFMLVRLVLFPLGASDRLSSRGLEFPEARRDGQTEPERVQTLTFPDRDLKAAKD